MNWTIGKWVTETQTDKRHKVVVVMTEDGESLIASAYAGHVGWKDAEANANLIAASPELYEALEAMYNDFTKNGGRIYGKSLEAAKAALAKARGEV